MTFPVTPPSHQNLKLRICWILVTLAGGGGGTSLPFIPEGQFKIAEQEDTKLSWTQQIYSFL